jgi:ADP-ribosylglycohydrolase
MNTRVDGMNLPAHHAERLARARLSLDGLSVGDAFGECFFGDPVSVKQRIEGRYVPAGPWWYTDDTAMAVSIYQCLEESGHIDRDRLAELFAEEFVREPSRGYGGTARLILAAIYNGVAWEKAAGEVFSGMGSLGNGGGMRVAPLGAYFAEDVEQLIVQARRSAEVTHAHPEGQAGAIAIALAAAWAWIYRSSRGEIDSREMIEFVVARTPVGDTHSRLRRGLDIPFEREPIVVGQMLGNGSEVSAPDTVPLAVWCAARHCWDFTTAVWETASAFGDVDTTCAMVGGIVALSSGAESIPENWKRARGNLPIAYP